MDCLEALKTRRSVRRYKPDMIPEQDLLEIMDAGRLAPTAGNFQPWEFIIARDKETIAALREATYNRQELFATAPVVIAVCADPKKSEYYGERGMNYFCILDCAIATQNMLLAAHALGYGGCWVGGFSESKVRGVLGIPDNIRVVSLMPVGKPAEGEPWDPPKRDLKDIMHWDRW